MKPKKSWWEERENTLKKVLKGTKGTIVFIIGESCLKQLTEDRQQHDKELKEILEIVNANVDEDNPMLNYKNKILIKIQEKIKEMIE